jgi:hypothetical protein
MTEPITLRVAGTTPFGAHIRLDLARRSGSIPNSLADAEQIICAAGPFGAIRLRVIEEVPLLDNLRNGLYISLSKPPSWLACLRAQHRRHPAGLGHVPQDPARRRSSQAVMLSHLLVVPSGLRPGDKADLQLSASIRHPAGNTKNQTIRLIGSIIAAQST